MENEQPLSPRRRLQQLLAIPDNQRSEAQWDEIVELEITLAPGNREDGPGRDMRLVTAQPQSPSRKANKPQHTRPQQGKPPQNKPQAGKQSRPAEAAAKAGRPSRNRLRGKNKPKAPAPEG